MGRSRAKPLLDQLAEAYEAGDKDKAKAISERIAKQLDASKPPRKRVQGQGDEAPGVPEPPAAPDSSYIATTLGPGGLANRGSRVGVDGRVRVEARHVSMAGRQNVNLFDQWLKEGGRGAGQLDRTIEKSEKILAKTSTYTPRPGMVGATRPVARKIQVYCGGCGRHFEIYSSEMMLLDDESEYKCDRCIRRGR